MIPSPGWGEACAWEWGGVVESVPLPCADPMVSRVLGAAVPWVFGAAVLGLIIAFLLLAVLVRLR